MPQSRTRSVILQHRDIELLKSLFECRLMALRHVAAIHFDGRKEAAKKRLQRLKSIGVITAHTRHANESEILILSTHGMELLESRGILARTPQFRPASFGSRASVSDATLRHELDVLDTKAAFHSAIRTEDPGHSLSISEFTTRPLLAGFTVGRVGISDVPVRPDGFWRMTRELEDGQVFMHAFFLELDRSTESLNVLVERTACYSSFYRSGGFSVCNGASRSEFRKHPFRVLIVLKSAERRNNVIEALLRCNPPILTLAWLSTLAEVKADPLGPIWIRPLDYRLSMFPSKVVPSRGPTHRHYRRQTERDALVERIVIKQRLFGDN